jgi:hypothetical protein
LIDAQAIENIFLRFHVGFVSQVSLFRHFSFLGVKIVDFFVTSPAAFRFFFTLPHSLVVTIQSPFDITPDAVM